MAAGDEPVDFDLRHYVRVLRRRAFVIAIAVTVVVVTAVVSSILQTPVYRAAAQMLITPTGAASSVFSQRAGFAGDPVREIQTQIQLITSRPITDIVKKQFGAAPPISVSPVGLTNVIQIQASSTIPSQAAEVANAYANAYIGFQRNQALETLGAAGTEIKGKIIDLQKQIDAVNAQVIAAAPPVGSPASPAAIERQKSLEGSLAPQRDSLVTQQALFKQRLDQLQVDASVKSGEAQLVTPATTPVSPASPKPWRKGVLALAIGLIYGVGVAFLLDYLDDAVRSRDDVDRAAHGLIALGVIPRIGGWKATEAAQVVSLSQPHSPGAEAYRSLRTSIQFAGLDRDARIIQLTSPNAKEGKTTTLANLGVALAGAGQRVCMCCCDLRRPRIHQFFGLDNAIGFTSVILGDRSASQAIQQVPAVDRLSLLASGPLPPNPSELLASERTAEVIRALAAMHDVVLLDCPPVLPVTDAAVIASMADMTILIVSVGDSAKREIGRAVELLRQVDAPLAGTVVNNVAMDGADGYYGSYHYYRAGQPTRETEKVDKDLAVKG